jgi:hypothetical protein
MFSGLIQSASSEPSNGGPEELSFLNMVIVDKAIDKLLKFKTEHEAFNLNYPKTDHLQKYFNEKAINHFV